MLMSALVHRCLNILLDRLYLANGFTPISSKLSFISRIQERNVAYERVVALPVMRNTNYDPVECILLLVVSVISSKRQCSLFFQCVAVLPCQPQSMQ